MKDRELAAWTLALALALLSAFSIDSWFWWKDHANRVQADHEETLKICQEIKDKCEAEQTE